MRQMSIGFPSIKAAGLPRGRSYRQDHCQAGSGDWQVISTGTRLIPKLGGDRPAVHAVVHAYPPVRKRHSLSA